MTSETATLPALPFEGRENLRGSLLASGAAHAALSALVLTWGMLHFGHGSWGNSWEHGSTARVQAVASLPGVPLPTPMRVTPNTVANENPGLYQTVPPPAPPVPEIAEQIPKFKDTVKPEESKRINKRIQKQELTPPPNAVPFGEGGHPAVSYNQFQTAAGEAGISFGEGNFGDRYGWYVDAMRSRISGNWLLSTISPNLMSAPRVYASFDIQRDGTISNIRLTQSSGNQEVDRSTLRAIQASNPLGPLPSDYSGSKVSVNFYFDFRR
jgi:periplasmic protein TonB